MKVKSLPQGAHVLITIRCGAEGCGKRVGEIAMVKGRLLRPDGYFDYPSPRLMLTWKLRRVWIEFPERCQIFERVWECHPSPGPGKGKGVFTPILAYELHIAQAHKPRSVVTSTRDAFVFECEERLAKYTRILDRIDEHDRQVQECSNLTNRIENMLADRAEDLREELGETRGLIKEISTSAAELLRTAEWQASVTGEALNHLLDTLNVMLPSNNLGLGVTATR